MIRKLSAVALLCLWAFPASANFNLFRRSSSPPAQTTYYYYPAPRVSYYYAPQPVLVAPPMCEPLEYPAAPPAGSRAVRPPRVITSPPPPRSAPLRPAPQRPNPPPPAPAVPQPPPRPMAPADDSDAVPQAAPPSPSGPIIPPPSRPMPSADRTAFYPTSATPKTESWYTAYSGGERPERPDVCAVTFWNLAAAPATLRVGKQTKGLSQGESVTLQLPREFAWRFAGRTAVTSHVPEGEDSLTVVIRR